MRPSRLFDRVAVSWKGVWTCVSLPLHGPQLKLDSWGRIHSHVEFKHFTNVRLYLRKDTWHNFLGSVFSFKDLIFSKFRLLIKW